jgi:hypothetical protein
MSGKKKRVRTPRDERWGLRDMFRNRPGGDAGKVMAGVWGTSLKDFDRAIEYEMELEQARNPGKFVDKIGPKGPPKK